MVWWPGAIGRSQINGAADDLSLIRSAGEATSIPKWRYWLLPAIAFAIARCFVYAMRYARAREELPDSRAKSPVIYAHFYPVCETALRPLKQAYPGMTIGFSGRQRFVVPIVRLGIAVLLSFLQPRVLEYAWRTKSWRPWLSDLLLYILVGRWARSYLEQRCSSVLVFSHDHSPFEKSLVRQANALGIRTVYVQHAAVTSQFPPLCATFSFLDGPQAVATYVGIPGSRGQVVMAGRQYSICSLRSVMGGSVVLLCTSPIDAVDDWRQVIETLQSAGYTMRLRSHPGERRFGRWQQLSSEFSIPFLAPTDSSLEDALREVDAVLAGTSAVLLDASLAGRVAVLVEFERDLRRGFRDHFGFIRHGIAWPARPDTIAADVTAARQAVAQRGSHSTASYFDVACISAPDAQARALGAILNASASAEDFGGAKFVRRSSTDIPMTFQGFDPWLPAEAIAGLRSLGPRESIRDQSE